MRQPRQVALSRRQAVRQARHQLRLLPVDGKRKRRQRVTSGLSGIVAVADARPAHADPDVYLEQLGEVGVVRAQRLRDVRPDVGVAVVTRHVCRVAALPVE